MTYFYFLIFLFTLSCKSSPKVSLPYVYYPIVPLNGEHIEASGLATANDRLYIVNDEDTKIYELTKRDSEYLANPILEIKLPNSIISEKESKLDFEGIAFCNNTFYISDERDRMIHSFQLRKSEIKTFKIRKKDYLQFYPNSISFISNFGAEGLACDEKSKTLFVGNEKRKKAIFYVSINDEKIYDLFPFNDEPTTNLFADDISGLTFFKDHLYVINRSKERIEKINPQTKTIISTLSYPSFADEIYEHKIYSSFVKMPEGIVIDDKHIYLALDSNGLILKGKTQSLSSIVVIDRPSDF